MKKYKFRQQIIIKGLDNNKRKIKTRELYVEGDQLLSKDLFAKICSTRLKKLTDKQWKDVVTTLYAPVRESCIEGIIKLDASRNRKDLESWSTTTLQMLYHSMEYLK